MAVEARIDGPILDEARKGRQKEKSVEQGREKAPTIHKSLNELFDKNVLRDEAGSETHDGRGWAKITVYLKPEETGYQPGVNLIRHVQSNRIDVWIEGLETIIYVNNDKIILTTLETVPQRGIAPYETMRIPMGSRRPDAPPFQSREANLEEVGYIEELTGILTDPNRVERIGNKLS